MTKFYKIEDRTFFTHGVPWIEKYPKGKVVRKCDECGGVRSWGTLEMVAELKANRCRLWPDLIGDGSVLLMVMSELFVNALREDGMRVEIGGRVTFAEPLRNGLSLSDAPSYYWIDGERMRAASIDYEASGHVGVWKCSACGRVSEDIRATSRRMSEDPPPPIAFDYDESLGFDLFTTDLTPKKFFCTERVLECAKRHRLTNIAFRPVEGGERAKPIKY